MATTARPCCSAPATRSAASPTGRITATPLGGAPNEASLLASEFTGNGKVDYAVLRRAVPPNDTTAWGGRAAPCVGELVVAVGYSNDCGLDPAGNVVFLGANVDPSIAPLVTLHEVLSADPLVLAPVAGAMPDRGASGGGLFDLDGNVVGVVTGVQYELGQDRVHLRVLGFSITAMPIP